MEYKNIQRQFQGYLGTQQLWSGELDGLRQFEMASNSDVEFKEVLQKKYRLGHLVECFVKQELEDNPSIKSLQHNIQFFEEKRTIGELDFLFKRDQVPVQLEVVYKFYLYDDSVGTTNLEHWIGPNRKDALTLKLSKIKEAQFPIVKHDEVRTFFNAQGYQLDDLLQRVYFKAQLFIPYGVEVDTKSLNQNCVIGFYLNEIGLIENFKGNQLYIPSKHDWLVVPHQDIDWLEFDTGRAQVEELLSIQRAPMIWLRNENEIRKAFVVWW